MLLTPTCLPTVSVGAGPRAPGRAVGPGFPEYQTAAHRLSPGDIIACHFRGPAQLHGETMVRMMTHLFRHIQAQGFTVADITKYA